MAAEELQRHQRGQARHRQRARAGGSTSSTSSISQGISGKMLVSGQASQTTKKVPNA